MANHLYFIWIVANIIKVLSHVWTTFHCDMKLQNDYIYQLSHVFLRAMQLFGSWTHPQLPLASASFVSFVAMWAPTKFVTNIYWIYSNLSHTLTSGMLNITGKQPCNISSGVIVSNLQPWWVFKVPFYTGLNSDLLPEPAYWSCDAWMGCFWEVEDNQWNVTTPSQCCSCLILLLSHSRVVNISYVMENFFHFSATLPS